jgi:hypothetical protein
MRFSPLDRRGFLRLGAAGLSMAAGLAGRASAAPLPRGPGFGRAKSCIVFFAWGGMSHLDTFDLKPDAPIDVRGPFHEIPTAVPGLRVGEHLPRLARHARRLAIVRSVTHDAVGHRPAAYWALTGHAPPTPNQNWESTRRDWPSLGAQVAKAFGTRVPAPFPGTVQLPYTMADGGRSNGQDGGFLGLGSDPVVFRPAAGAPYDGRSPEAGTIELGGDVDVPRWTSRRDLLSRLETAGRAPDGRETEDVERWRDKSFDLLLDARAAGAFDLEGEPRRVREAYGGHIAGQSALLARKLTEAGVPLVTVIPAAGDLNGSIGAHWDTHADNFNRLKDQMLPPLDQASAALLDDLADRGRLDETLVVWLTEFGRTPRISGGAGRDHYPGCYSVAFAGGGIQGGRAYGRSDATGAQPVENPCGPPDLQATIFHALGIDPAFDLHDIEGRPLRACDGRPLPLFS